MAPTLTRLPTNLNACIKGNDSSTPLIYGVMSEQPHSSQTAPIDEYRVLWTTQKKQKLKRWHDGFLRFHKFNKRMLVYDDARHLVADMYLRGRDSIGEGDDLEFEHHLVTVEDFKGTVIQDLTPIFSPAVQRKQLLQAGNALANSPTPNQANRHRPWGPSPHATPTLQSVQQRPMAVARPPQTPVQRRRTNTPGTALQQSIRANNNIKHPHPYQNRPLGPVQPSNAPPNAPTRMEPPQRPNTVSRPNLPQKSHPPLRLDPPQWQNQPPSPTQESRPWSNPVPPTYGNKRPLLSDPSGPQSVKRRSNPPSPRSNNVPSRPPPSGTNHGPIAAFDLEDIESPLPPGRPTGLFSHPIPHHENKSTPNIATDIDSDEDLFGSLPDFQVPASPARPVSVSLSRKNDVLTGFVNTRAQKRSSAVLGADNDSRAFRLPSKREAAILPERPHQGSSRGLIANIDTNADIVSDPGKDSNPRTFRPPHKQGTTTLFGDPQPGPPEFNRNNDKVSGLGEDSGKEPFEPLIGAGTLCLGVSTKRRRNKLLCQRPLSTSAETPKEPLARSTEQRPVRENPAKKYKIDSVSKPPPPPPPPPPEIAGGTVVIEGDTDEPPVIPPPVAKKRMDGFKFQGPKRANKSIESRDSDKGKSRGSGPTPAQEHRIEEEEDTLEYQQENDIGPWSSEAFDLFDWRPPNMRGEK